MDKKQEPRNPASQQGQSIPASDPLSPDQIIPKKGEEYLREGGNIEDLPDTEELDESQGMKGE